MECLFCSAWSLHSGWLELWGLQYWAHSQSPYWATSQPFSSYLQPGYAASCLAKTRLSLRASTQGHPFVDFRRPFSGQLPVSRALPQPGELERWFASSTQAAALGLQTGRTAVRLRLIFGSSLRKDHSLLCLRPVPKTAVHALCPLYCSLW